MNISPYLRLMRLHKPVGIWLLLWPTWSALWLAAEGPPPWILFLSFTAGVVVMRSLGCVINDMADQKFDADVPRTQDRVLVRKELSTKEAFFLSAALLLLAFLCLLPLKHVFILACIALGLAIFYPFVKRFSHLPQVVLGMAYAMGIPMAIRAHLGILPSWTWILYAATLLWVIAFDTEYAMTDRPADQHIGVHSTALLFGHYDRLIISILFITSCMLWGWLGMLLHLSISFWIALCISASMMVQQIFWIRNQEPTQGFRAFLHNQWVGLVLFLGIVFHYGARHFCTLLPS